MSLTWPTVKKVVTQPFGGANLAEPHRYFEKDARGHLRCAKVTFAGHDGERLHYHDGLDMRVGYEGSPLVAMEAGTVTAWPTYQAPGVSLNLGIVVRIKSGVTYAYWHCQKRIAPVGSQVTKGQKIALAGKSGATGIHCHGVLNVTIGGIRYYYNLERFLPAHSRVTSTGSLVAVGAGDLVDVPVITIMAGSITPTGDLANIREQPNTSQPPVGTLAAGKTLPYGSVVQGETVKGNPDWFKVQRSRFVWGYISASVAKKV